MRFFLLLALIGCGQPTTEAPTEHDAHAGHAEPDAHAEPEAHAGHDAHAAHSPDAPAGTLTLALNGDAKWQMDEHTRTVIGETRTSLASTTVATAEDAHALGTTLQGQLDTLIRGCEMTGADHDQLHVFLTAYMPAVAGLQNVEDADAATAHTALLTGMLVEYDRVFE